MNNDLDKKLTEIQFKTRSREDMKKLFVKKNVFAQERALAEDALKSSRVSAKSKEIIRRQLDNGAFQKESLEVDQKVAARLDRNTEKAMRDAISTGKLERFDPRKDTQARTWLKKTGRLK